MSVSSHLGEYPNDKDTLLPGRWVDPAKLENLLNGLFDDQYAVSMRNSSYVVWASRRLCDDEKKRCLRPASGAFTRML
ncbi:hypothetical protein BHE90_003608 [Fusarium euwallaceae]|uniref:Uncharacterized protein n=2 Tax=Fusarium solani species complex TaxID=232080 RepID=A0A428UDH8_9HYPO|nr:hypothetical protein CEP52_002469 [Fusarium oligoseptatum]RTE81896.1 hypothetical protein BHE90_003608 [Fusarium euwallaceae]